MNPEPKPQPETEVADFSEVLSPRDGSEPPVIVGGHAANLAFITELAAQVAEGKFSAWTLVNFLGEIWEVVTSSQARSATRMWDFDFTKMSGPSMNWHPLKMRKSHAGSSIDSRRTFLKPSSNEEADSFPMLAKQAA